MSVVNSFGERIQSLTQPPEKTDGIVLRRPGLGDPRTVKPSEMLAALFVAAKESEQNQRRSVIDGLLTELGDED